jgi:16S rRNA (guanine527-N7)-methyltransferase
MDRLTRWSMPLVTAGGLFLAMKGASAEQELESAARTIRRLGGVDPTVVAVGGEWLRPPVRVVLITKTDSHGRTGRSSKRAGEGH